MKTPRNSAAIGLVLAAMFGAAASAVGYELSNGRRILLNRGLQIEGYTLSLDRTMWHPEYWAQANFTAFSFGGNYTEGHDPNNTDGTILARLPQGTLWSRNATLGHNTLFPEERPFAANMVSFPYLDEATREDGSSGTKDDPMTHLGDYYHQYRYVNQHHPNTLAYTAFWGEQLDSYWPGTSSPDTPQLRTYMRTTMPDMMCFDTYPHYLDNNVSLWYTHMAKYRKVALEGIDGAGTKPLPYGQYLQSFREGGLTGPLPSESLIRLQQNAAWAFGFTWTQYFYYNSDPNFTQSLVSTMFSSYGDDPAHRTPVFGYVAETNRQSRNLGPALVRLVSTDVRMIPATTGTHTEYSPSWPLNPHRVDDDAPLPGGIAAWSPGTASTGKYKDYITGITPLGKDNGASHIHSDVVISYFVPLLDDNGPNHTFVDGLHFMIVNGAAGNQVPVDANGIADPAAVAANSAAALTESYRLTFDFTGSDFDSLVRLSRDTGLVELVTLTSLGNQRYSYDLALQGGTGDLFAFWNSSKPLPTIPEPSSLTLLGLALSSTFVYTLKWRG